MSKLKLCEKGYLIGTWSEVPSAYMTDILVKSGIDFIILDMEHGVIDFNTAFNMILATKNRKNECCSFIRVSNIEETNILRALDLGADGIIVPQVRNKSDIEKIVNYSKYYPTGNRGYNPYITAGEYGSRNGKNLNMQNDSTLIGIIVENKECLDCLAEIVSNENIDIIYVGQYDLSVALGIPGDVNNEKVLKAIDDVISISKKYNKTVGCMVHSEEEAVRMIKKGIKFITYQVDSGVIFKSYNNFLEGVAKNAKTF